MIECRVSLLRVLGLAAACALLLAVTGCASAPAASLPPYDYRADAVKPPAPRDGAIWSDASSMALFEDQRARHRGDVLTVLLVEKTDAAKSASTSTSKDTSSEIGNPTVLGTPLIGNGSATSLLGLSSTHSFDGAGDSAQSNKLQGSVSVIVRDVLPNGNLVIAGHKDIVINQGTETVSLEGIVRPQDIGAGNTVTSDRVAEARIRYAGSGAVADVNATGWLQRFFTSVFFPF